MSKYNVSVYIRLLRDDNYSDSNSIDNQIKLIEFYCKNNDLKIAEKYIDNIFIYEDKSIEIIFK